MVGRGGRSKGCESCRQRHLKCDQGQPYCQRCIRDDFECRYPPPKFINAFQKPVAEREKEPPRKAALVKRHIQFDLDVTMVTYLQNTIFALAPDDPGHHWPGFDALSFHKDDLPVKCLTALSESWFGHAHASPQMIKRGQQQYSTCLRHVNDTLSKGLDGLKGNTILAILILGHYEMLFATTPSGWAKHALGCALVFELTGPEICSNKTCFHVFQSMRFTMSLGALVVGRRSFLSRPEWKTRPWECANEQKNDMDYLQDITCELMNLRAFKPTSPASSSASSPSDDYSFSCGSDDDNGMSTHGLALRYLGQLHTWFWNWHAKSPPQLVPAVPVPGDDVPKPWATEYHHGSLYAANCFVLYHVGVIFGTQIALLTAGAEDLGPGDAAVLHAAARQSGVEICRSVDYEIFHTNGRQGQLTVLVPMEKAYEIVGKGFSPEGRWLEQRARQINEMSNSWAVSRQVLLQRDISPRVPYVTGDREGRLPSPLPS